MTMYSRRWWLRSSVIGPLGVALWRPASEAAIGQKGSSVDPTLAGVKALVFDVFGTVVDWRSSVATEMQALATRKQITVDGAKFADAWRAGYAPSMPQRLVRFAHICQVRGQPVDELERGELPLDR